jgi:hypothetical protein
MLMNALKSIDLTKLSQKEKDKLAEIFKKRKAELEKALEAVSQGLERLK